VGLPIRRRTKAEREALPAALGRAPSPAEGDPDDLIPIEQGALVDAATFAVVVGQLPVIPTAKPRWPRPEEAVAAVMVDHPTQKEKQVLAVEMRR